MLALVGLVLAGCAGLRQELSQPPGAVLAPAVAVVAPGDPVAAFAATATPGAEGQVVLPGSGQPARVRLLRAYHAASGRECREVLLGTGFEERSSVVCQGEAGWAMARPLLQGGSRAP